MELRDLRAFVAAAHELHFSRAAASLYMTPSTMTETIRHLERELGTPLFTRTTRRVALTEAGTELLGRAETILALAAQATQAVEAIARGAVGTIRLGVTPPAAPVIAPHLVRLFTGSSTRATVDVQRMWQPSLGAALLAGLVDLALTCGDLGIDDPNIATVEIGSDRLFVGLRADHPLSTETTVDLHRLTNDTLGMHPAHLFPAWHAAQRRVLADANIAPRVAELDDADLSAHRWTNQPEVDWIMLIGSLLAGHEHTAVRPARPTRFLSPSPGTQSRRPGPSSSGSSTRASAPSHRRGGYPLRRRRERLVRQSTASRRGERCRRRPRRRTPSACTGCHTAR